MFPILQDKAGNGREQHARNQFRFNRAAAGINASNLFETMTYTGLTRLSNSSALLTYNRYFADWLQAMRTRLAFHFI
jgi:hypothetical protein